MNISSLSDEALRNKISQLGKEMTSSSSPTAIAKESERMIYVKELFKRKLGGLPSKRKYRP